MRILAALAILGVVGYGNYASGYEISFYLLYAFPIAWIAWSTGLWWGIGLGALSSAVWGWVDIAAGHHYERGWIVWERVTMNFATFAFIAYSFDQFRRNLTAQSWRLTLLEGALPVCVACKRINTSEGPWVDLDTYLEKYSAAKAQRCLCPNCRGSFLR